MDLPVNLPLLAYLADEMAKKSEKHFFRALIKLGIVEGDDENDFEAIAKKLVDHGSTEKSAISSK